MKTLKARLNHGRWIVDCPDCTSACLAIPGQDFFCMDEALAAARAEFDLEGRDKLTIPSHEFLARAYKMSAGLTHYPVKFPPDKDAIDDLMTLRPNDENKNWEPGETLADLRRENKAHGIKV